jgi:proteasome lid subunit RPN8/RPN11
MSKQSPRVTLNLTGMQYEKLKAFLLLPDGKEAAAIALCGRRAGLHRHRLLVQEVHPVPEEAYSNRSEVAVTWSTDWLVSLLNKAEAEGLSVVKIHSHPGGYADFSDIDDVSDRTLMPAIRGWIEADVPHASVIMLPDGQMFGRVLWEGNEFQALDCIAVVGSDLHFWYADLEAGEIPNFAASHAQAFGKGTTERLQRLSIAVVGCSGTGSPVIEQLVRLGVGELILVDDDYIEHRNINRILNSTVADAEQQKPKSEMLAATIHRIGLGTKVQVCKQNLWNREVVEAVAGCDIVFGCMDTLEGRFLLNTLATYYLIPYFDLGVRLDAITDGESKGRIREVCGTVHYLQPGLSSLMSRGLVTMEGVQADGLRRRDPEAYGQQLEDGYIRGVDERRPAVISVNMFTASLAVNDLLSRLHSYREMPNCLIASIEFSLSSLDLFADAEEDPCPMLQRGVGLGDCEPLLHLIELAA